MSYPRFIALTGVSSPGVAAVSCLYATHCIVAMRTAPTGTFIWLSDCLEPNEVGESIEEILHKIREAHA